jgi:rhamnosyltransferase
VSNLGKVAACVISYNPDLVILKVVEAATQQAGEVLVIDNNSSPETGEWLAQACDELHATVIRNAENRGVAGALNQAAELALSQGFAWMLILDQDSVPPAALVEQLMTALQGSPIAEQTAVVCPRIVKVGRRVSGATSRAPLKVVYSAWNAGSVIRLAAWKSVGGYDERLFVDYVDHDFCLRCRQKGWKTVQVMGAIMRHSPGSPTIHRLLGKQLTASNHSVERRYSIARNRTVCYRRYWRSSPGWIAHDIGATTKDVLVILFFESHRWRKIAASVRGAIAGLRWREDSRRMLPR